MTRRTITHDGKTALAGAAVGALLEFVFDPREGRRRRSLARDRTAGAIRRTLRRGGRRVRAGVSHTRGYGARVAHAPRHDSLVDPNDATLARKVETVIFRPADVPKGQIVVNAQNGIVQLRGEVPRPELVEELERKTRKIQGVRDVENLLHHR